MQAMLISWAIKAAWLAGMFAAGWTLHWWDSRQDCRNNLTELQLAAAEALVKVEREAREQEREHRERIDAIAAQFEHDRAQSQAAADRVAADLRDGALRLRAEWRGCETARLSATAAAAAEPDGRAADRIESAGRIIRAAAECDAQVRGLQATLRARQ